MVLQVEGMTSASESGGGFVLSGDLEMTSKEILLLATASWFSLGDLAKFSLPLAWAWLEATSSLPPYPACAPACP